MSTLPLPPEARQDRPKPISVSDREAQKAERDELLRVATALYAARLAADHEHDDPNQWVDHAQMLIASVNARFA